VLSQQELVTGELAGSEIAGFAVNLTMLDPALDVPGEIAQRAQLLVVEVCPDQPASLKRLARVREEHPHLPIIAAVRDTSIPVVRTMLRAGVSDVIPLPLTHADLASALSQLRDEIDRNATSAAGRMVSVIKSVGGVGATSLLVQAASLYAARESDRGRQVCLFDLDLQGGNVATYLGLTPALTLTELLEAGKRVDGALLRSVTTRHAGGLDVIAAPAEMMPLEAIDTDQICDIVELATHEFGTVFLDLPSDWTNWSLSLVARSQVVLLVVELTIASLRQAQRQLALLERLGVAPDAIQVVVNRVEKSLFKPIDLGDAKEALNRPVAFSVANDFALMSTALNQGLLIGDIKAKTKVGRDLGQILDGIDQLVGRE
jgi:pilus assembly protein CpaE